MLLSGKVTVNKVGGDQPGLFHFVSLLDSCLLCRRADVSIAQPCLFKNPYGYRDTVPALETVTLI